MKVRLSVAGIGLAVMALAMPAYGDDGDWTGPGYYIADSSSFMTGFAAGPFSTEAECKSALAALPSDEQSDSSCDYYANDPFKSLN